MKRSKGSDAQQESRILMLSPQARGDANPILLIDDNDVTARTCGKYWSCKS